MVRKIKAKLVLQLRNQGLSGRSIASAQGTIDHLDGYIEEAAGGVGGVPMQAAWHAADTAMLRDWARRTREAGLFVVPTQFLWQNLMYPPDPDSAAARFEMRYGRRLTTTISVKVADTSNVDEMMARAEEAMRVAHGLRPSEENDFSIETSDALVSFWRQLTAVLFAVVPAVVAIGIVAGLAGAFALNRLIASLLFGVQPTDPVTMVAVIATITLVAAVACWIPAWRASRVDPNVVLRDD